MIFLQQKWQQSSRPLPLLRAISYINHWYKNKIRTHSHRELSSDYAVLVTRAGIEPTLTAWEAAVLTAWPTGHNKKRSRHLPIFTGRFQPTIFGTSELNFCVRNGNRWNLTVIDTGHSHGACHASLLLRMYPQNWISNRFLSKQSIWSRWGQALDLLVHASWTDHSAYTVCLSTL